MNSAAGKGLKGCSVGNIMTKEKKNTETCFVLGINV